VFLKTYQSIPPC